MKYIDKSALVAEIERRIQSIHPITEKVGIIGCSNVVKHLREVLSFLDTLKAKDLYEQCVQYDSIKAGIQAHAETYSFNIESELFNQLTKGEQQELWRKEIEQAYIIGGETGVELAKDPRYKENLDVKEIDLKKDFELTWEDVAWITAKVILKCKVESTLTAEDICKDVLKQFKTYKGE